jgi:hypothetical protein
MHHDEEVHTFVVVLVERVRLHLSLELLDLFHTFNVALFKENRLQIIKGSQKLGVSLRSLLVGQSLSCLLLLHIRS